MLENARDEESSGYIDGFNGDGYISLCIVYGVAFFCDFFAASTIAALGLKNSLLLGSVTYSLFIASFYALKTELLYTASALLGMGATLTWVSQVINLIFPALFF